MLLVQKISYEQVVARIKPRLLPIHLRRTGDERAAGRFIVERQAFANVIGVTLANPLREPVIRQPPNRTDGQRMGDLMSDKVIQRAIAVNLISRRGISRSSSMTASRRNTFVVRGYWLSPPTP